MQTGLRFGVHWHVLAVATGDELAVVGRLAGLDGVEAYCPARKVWRRVNGHQARKLGRKSRFEQVALIPGYVFVRVDLGEVGARAIVETAKGHYVLTANGMACKVRDQLIAALRDGEETNCWDQVIVEKEKLQSKLGHPHLIQSGPMRGFIGILKSVDFECLDPAMVVTVELLQKNVDIVLEVNSELMQEAN
jgi:transcription antitermination factor NusG